MIKLFELRTEKNLSQRDIAKILNISQATYNNWENSNTQPSIEQLIVLSKFFDVSVDYLIGNTDEFGAPMNTGNENKYQQLLNFFKSANTETQSAILTLLKNLHK